MKKRVLLGMSSGIDSSVSAILLKKSGFEVIGITFIFSEIEYQNSEMMHSVKTLSEKLNIEHHVVDLRKEFQKEVISYFEQEYINGRTPFPCAVCNPRVKFKNLKYYANLLDCDFISSGHYVQVVEKEGFKYISKGIDKEKDQAFFLWGLPSDIVNRLIFPLGKFTKEKVRKIAKENGFHSLTKKKESLGICFIEDNDYRNYLKSRGFEERKGNFVDLNGEILGNHKGYFNYTIGQRHGLGLNLNTPKFVSEIRPAKNEVVLADFKALEKSTIFIDNCHFFHPNKLDIKKKYIVKIRYRLQENSCIIRFLNDNQVRIELDEPVPMVAKGQTAVLFDNNRVVGGGFIFDSK
jgi:tRNA-specific 2-thiouridylase